jgi:RNA polymerase sigma factor (sigma-70 family)
MTPAEDNLDELFASFSIELNRYMFKLTGDKEDAADLVQEAFLRLCQQESLPEHPRAWLSKTSYRLFVDRWRRNQRVVWLPLDPTLPGTTSLPEQAAIDREFDTKVRRLLSRLHPRTREAFHLRIYGQYNYGEIASLLGCSENTIKSCMRRGRASLSKWL